MEDKNQILYAVHDNANQEQGKFSISPVNPKALFGAHIKVVGVGGSGSNAINHMINSGVYGVDFIAINCDSQDLFHSKAKKKIQIGKNITRGLGAGMDVDVGRRAAEETRNEIQDALKGADMVFITYGMGGGTGTGAAPIVAEVAKKQGALTLAVVTKPFSFEGALRAEMAEEGLRNLIEVVDTAIVIPNDRLLKIVDKKTRLTNAFALCDDVLKNAVQGISELIIKPGIINVDFADVRTIMVEAGPAIMGIGQAKGDKRAIEAAKKAISSPLLDISIDGATGVLFVVSGGKDLTLSEIKVAAEVITESVDPEAKIIFGAIQDEDLNEGEIKVTVIAAGFPNQGSKIITKTEEIEKTEQRDSEGNPIDENDMDTPAFMRRANSTKQRKSSNIAADIKSKPVKNKFLENYTNKDQNQGPRSNNSRDFNKSAKGSNEAYFLQDTQKFPEINIKPFFKVFLKVFRKIGLGIFIFFGGIIWIMINLIGFVFKSIYKGLSFLAVRTGLKKWLLEE